MSSIASVLVVDRYPLVREGLKRVIDAEPDFSVCGETGSARQARTLARATRPHIVTLDFALQDGSGMELIRRLTSEDAELKVLVCSMQDELLFAERAVRAGAHGFIDKYEAAQSIPKALRQIRAGNFYLRPPLVDRLIKKSVGIQPGPGSPMEALSDRELEVFMLIARACSTGEIAKQLLISVKTVDTHRDKIKRKLGLKSAAELIRAAVLWDAAQGGATLQMKSDFSPFNVNCEPSILGGSKKAA